MTVRRAILSIAKFAKMNDLSAAKSLRDVITCGKWLENKNTSTPDLPVYELRQSRHIPTPLHVNDTISIENDELMSYYTNMHQMPQFQGN